MYKKIFSIIVNISVVLLFIHLFIIGVQLTEGPSMLPTIDENVLLVKRFPHKINRGDIVIFYHKGKIVCKRIIGLPGETICISDDGYVYINGERREDLSYDNTYIEEFAQFGYENNEITLDKKTYFVLGDNRGESADSRVFGPIKKIRIIAKVIHIFKQK